MTASSHLRSAAATRSHAHVVVGKRDATAHGGHFVRAHVRPTLELVLEQSPAHLRKRHDEETDWL